MAAVGLWLVGGGCPGVEALHVFLEEWSPPCQAAFATAHFNFCLLITLVAMEASEFSFKIDKLIVAISLGICCQGNSRCQPPTLSQPNWMWR